MDTGIYVLTSHPLVRIFVAKILSLDPKLRRCPLTCVEPSLVSPHERRCLFVLDTCFNCMQVADLLRITRARFPASKFLALVHPGKSNDEDLLRLLYMGFDGVLTMTEEFDREFPEAIHSILAGDIWAPRMVERKFVTQTKLLLDEQLWPHRSLTARENQIFQLLVRRLSNKEIASVLGISERTAKFHVSNVFAKLDVRSRSSFFGVADLAHVTPLLSR